MPKEHTTEALLAVLTLVAHALLANMIASAQERGVEMHSSLRRPLFG